MTTTFHSDQAGMAFFLLVCTLFNIWFLVVSGRRVLCSNNNNNNNNNNNKKEKETTTATDADADDVQSLHNVERSVFVMALFDIPWVWLCAFQCLYNTFTPVDDFHQNSGEDSLGCRFMGWYSSFSMVSMMGSNCLVAFYLLRYKRRKNLHNVMQQCFWDRSAGLATLAFGILVAACLFASMPLIQGDGYLYTNGGFCYADFTNSTQSSIMLTIVVLLLTLSTVLWVQLGLAEYRLFYGIFFVTWVLWIPAGAYGIASGTEIASPYMIIGAIVGHGNALVNPILYGWYLFVKLDLQKEENLLAVTLRDSLHDEEEALTKIEAPTIHYT